MKTCSKCKVEKELTEFHRDRTSKNGRRNKCRVCTKSYTRSRYLSRKEEALSWQREYYKRNQELRMEYNRNYYYRNREWFISNVVARAANNPEKELARKAKRRATKLSQTPEMNKAELVEIESMYLYNQVMPGTWHVDHIQPLAAGGLHHPSNLQILSEHDNCSKGATWG